MEQLKITFYSNLLCMSKKQKSLAKGRLSMSKKKIYFKFHGEPDDYLEVKIINIFVRLGSCRHRVCSQKMIVYVFCFHSHDSPFNRLNRGRKSLRTACTGSRIGRTASPSCRWTPGWAWRHTCGGWSVRYRTWRSTEEVRNYF